MTANYFNVGFGEICQTEKYQKSNNIEIGDENGFSSYAYIVYIFHSMG